MEGREEDELQSSVQSMEVPVYTGIYDQRRGLAKRGRTCSHLQQRSLPVPCLLPHRHAALEFSASDNGISSFRTSIPSGHLCQELPGPKRGRQGRAGGGWGCPGKGARGRMDGAAQGKVPRRGGRVLLPRKDPRSRKSLPAPLRILGKGGAGGNEKLELPLLKKLGQFGREKEKHGTRVVPWEKGTLMARY